MHGTRTCNCCGGTLVEGLAAVYKCGRGVTDGSNACPGMVGEFLQSAVNINFQGYPLAYNENLTAIILPPGDWDIRVTMGLTVLYGFVQFILQPQPPGLSNDLGQADIAVIGSGFTQAAFYSNLFAMARANVSVPTPLIFNVIIDQSGNSALTGGSALLVLEARRMR